jgi:hypothetical protein
MVETGERFPWFDRPFWEDACVQVAQLARDEGDAVARASAYFAVYSHHLLFALMPFRLLALGQQRDADGWLAMRPAVETCGEAVEASGPLAELGYAGMLERNRLIVDRTLELIDERSAAASREKRESVAATRGLLTRRQPGIAGACKRKPDGRRPIWGDRSKPLGHEPKRGYRDFHLQHPRDHDFRQARAGIDDDRLLALVDAWIADLDHNYRELVTSIPADCGEHAELELEAGAVEVDPTGAALIGLPSPARMRVLDRAKGEVSDVEAVATHLLLVDGGCSPQPDGITLMPGERWRIRGHRLEDRTIMPCWGTHRVGISTPATGAAAPGTRTARKGAA